jgi:TonB family protein
MDIDASMPALAAWLLQATLALTLALALLFALRTPLRHAFGARVAYAAWWLAPACLVAPLLPVPAAAPRVFAAAGDTLSALPALVASTGAATQAVDARPWLLVAWILGAMATAWLFARRQRSFEGRIQRRPGEAWDAIAGHGPAVAGLLRPRILLPEDFERRYTPHEQALVLAHERLHLLRGDVAAQAAASALRCLFWFHPLVHAAASAFRFDQELACDADVLARFPGSRRAYGDAMLKTQLAGAGLPIGCHWQSNHPLKERLSMLKQPKPGALRRNAGRGLVALVLALGTYAAWATQPAAKAASGERIAVDFSISVDGGSPATPKVIVFEGEAFGVRVDGLSLDLVARRNGHRIELRGSASRDGRELGTPELVLVDGAEGFQPASPQDIDGGISLQARAHTMAADEPNPLSKSAGAPWLQKLTEADSMATPAYPKAALAAGTHGKLSLLVYVDPKGDVTDARVESSDPAGVFDQAALAAARTWHFSEQARDSQGKRPSGWMRTQVEFHPDGAPKG